ncbi:hypothetical protein GBK02_07795 [Dechloromonas sp. TW-R-39-2]|nr:hypothetical protein GBK02_07795 [Dechloromonas sp. TW-R-39-2]
MQQRAAKQELKNQKILRNS